MAIAIATFGCTDETFGYVTRLRKRNSGQQRKTANGAGTVKYVNFYGLEEEIEIDYVYISTDAAWSGNVANGTAITIADAAGGTGWYIREHELIREGGDNPREQMARIVANRWPSLAA